MARNLWDYYTLEDCMAAADIWTTFDSGYCPVAIKAPDQVTELWEITNISIDENVCENKFHSLYINYKPMTLKLAFAIKVWRLAHVVIKKLYHNNCEWKFNWQKRDESFNQLVPFRTDISCFVENFLKTMKYICDKKMVTVSEGYWMIDRFSQNDSHDMSSSLYKPRAIVVLNSIDNLEEFEILNYPYDKTLRIFSWEDIKDLFVEVTIPQLELLHGEKINRMETGDEMLFEACRKLDLDGIKQAVKEGANPKALNEFGYSTIYQCVDTCVNYCGMSEVDDEEEDEEDDDNYDDMAGIIGLNDDELLSRTKACIDFLLEQGVDINLFGYGAAVDVLYPAVHYNTADLMKYLLEKGAIPNFNSDVEDIVKSNNCNWDIKSTVLQHLNDDFGADGETDARNEMEQLLNEYGAELYIDGYSVPIDEEEFLNIISKIYSQYTLVDIYPHMELDFHYSSFWVFTEITSAAEYIDYITGKAQALKESGKVVKTKIMHVKGSGKPCLVLEQEGDDDPACLMVELSDNGLVARMDMMPCSFYNLI